jgi:catechol 2,3-dioxygenase-like lactoylglutathione lyase family enzyme
MDKRWQVSSLSHFTLAVRNLERSVEFYEKVGFQMIDDRRNAIWPASVAENFGMRSASGRGVLMAIDPASVHTRLDLIEWLEPILPEPTIPVEERVPQLIALLTVNAVAAADDLAKEGVKFIVVRDDEEHKRLGIKAVAMCRDPDENLVEFIEYMPGFRNSRPNDILPKRLQ